MKLKLIFPKGQTHNFWDLKFSAKISGRKYAGIPLSLPTVAALTPKDIDIEIIDENVEPIDFNDRVDLVGISFFTAFANRAYEIADEFRKRGVAVVFGGIHASALPKEALQHADSVVVGEAEDVWGSLIQDFREGELKNIYTSQNYPDLKNSPIPRWDLVKVNNYTFNSVQSSRGCPFDCEFCSVKSFLGQECRFKQLSSVLKEIEHLHNLNYKKGIVFADDNILSDKRYTKDLVSSLIKIGIKNWWCQASINISQRLRTVLSVGRRRDGAI